MTNAKKKAGVSIYKKNMEIRQKVSIENSSECTCEREKIGEQMSEESP